MVGSMDWIKGSMDWIKGKFTGKPHMKNGKIMENNSGFRLRFSQQNQSIDRFMVGSW